MPDYENFHLDKSVSLSHIIATIGLVMGAVFAFTNLSERLSVLESQFTEINVRVVSILEAQQHVDEVQDNSLLEFRREMRDETRMINQKLDQLIQSLIP